MAFFDFLKGKNKKQEEIKTQEPTDLLEVEGLDITPMDTDSDNDGVKIPDGANGSAALNRAVRNALDVNEVHFTISAAGTMYNKENPDDEDIKVVAEEEVIEDITIIAEEDIEDIPAIAEEEVIEDITIIAEEDIEDITAIAEEAIADTPVIAEKEVIEDTTVIAEEEAIADIADVTEQPATKKGFFAKLVEGLGKTRKSIMDNVDNVLGAFTKIDEDLFEELEEVLIMADIGVETTLYIIENLRKRVKKEKTTDPKAIKGLLADEITAILSEDTQTEEDLPSPTVMLVIGVNGAGKTTTIGKLANSFKLQGKTVLLAAADTFRAAAIDQLEIWGERADIEVIKHQENADPAAVVFDAVNAAKRRNIDLLICDTAGRLHNKKNLMEELKKIAKVIDREHPQAHKEIYLVLDATTGQNAMQQARLFKEVADITGIILTKLDGTAKGGIVIAIKSELKIPVRYIGVGEGIADLQSFDAKQFAKALFSNQED